MSYQAVIRDAGNSLVSNHPVGMRISILQGSTAGLPVYVETQTPTTNANGLVTVEIGSVTPVSGTFAGIDWSTGIYFIKTETDPTGGTNYTITGTSQLLSVPYALFAETAKALTRTITINGITLDLIANRSWSVGTVTSVGLSLPGLFSVSGSPVTTSGTLSANLASQTSNMIFASPNGITGAPSFRALVATDIPNLDWTKITSGKPTTLLGYGITDGVNTTGNQIIAGNKTFSGTTTVPAPVNATDAATKAYVDVLLNKISDLESLTTKVKDIDGNLYSTVKIGNQVWMVENLKTTKFNDGTIIPNVTDNATWAALTTGAYCDNNNDPVMSTTYGKLYNYYAVVDVHQLCPTGWHVPTDDEWETLVSDYLGNIFFSGGKLKEAGTTHWIDNYGATNESGFTALPGGDRSYDGTFFDVGISGHWWTATEFIPISAGQIYLNSGSTRAYWGDDYKANKKNALSVRCIKD